MAIFIKPRGDSFGQKITINAKEGVVTRRNAANYCLDISGEAALILKDKEGEPVKDGELKVGQRAYLNLGSISTDQYHFLIIPNPILSKHAYVGGPLLVEPHSTEELEFMLRVEKQINVNNLPYLFRIYVVD